MLLQGENLHTRIQMRQELSHQVQECLQQLLSHLNWRLQVWNDLATAPVANVSETASPSPTVSETLFSSRFQQFLFVVRRF